MTLTLEQMRADIANALYVEPAEITDDAVLADLGLDSMRLMDLMMEWEAAGMKADFGTLAEYSTLGDWWALIERSAA